MRRNMLLALSLVLMLPVMAAAQRGEGRGPREERAMPMRSQGVAFMLEHASTLELTADQTERLKGIQARHEERTAPLRARADSIRPDRDGERRDLDATALRQRRQAMAEIMTLMREERQSARAEAFELLSSDQRKKVDALEAEQRKQRDERRDRSGGRRGSRPPA